MHHLLNVILEICPSNFDDQLPLSTSASASACRMRPFAELSGFLLSCCLNNPTVHDPTTQKKKRMEQLNLNFHHAVSPFTTQFLRNVAYFLLATSALYMPTASEVSFRPRLIQLILCLSGGVTWKATHVGCRIQGLGVIDRSHGESPVSE